MDDYVRRFGIYNMREIPEQRGRVVCGHRDLRAFKILIQRFLRGSKIHLVVKVEIEFVGAEARVPYILFTGRQIVDIPPIIR
jgi:hypothetical protein